MSEKSYKRAIENGVDFLKKAIQAKSAKKKVKLARKSTLNFKKAISLSKNIGLQKKTPYIYEYLQQIQAQLGASLLELKKTSEAIQIFKEALDSNAKTPQNIKQKEIKSYLLAELAKIYLSRDQLKPAENYANQALAVGAEKNFNQEDLLDLYIELNPVFIRMNNLNKIMKNYHMMVKLAKRDDRKHIKAQVYFAYGKFLHGIKRDDQESKKYLQKAHSLFQSLGIKEGYEEVIKFIESSWNSTNKEEPDSIDLNNS